MWRTCGLAVLSLAASVASAGEADRLAAGATRERELAAGQTHSYEVRLETGDFLHAIATPRCIDVGLRLMGPDGREILSVDLQDDPLSPEQVLVVADTPGLYRIDVVAPTADVPTGRYTLSIEAVSPATGVDAIRIGAMRKLEAGFRLRRTAEAASRRQALAELEAARSAFREVDDREGEARALMQIALISHYLGRPEGLDLARQALALCRALGNPLRLAEALNGIGQIQDRGGQGAEALDFYTEALGLAQSQGNTYQEAVLRLNLGVLYGRSGDLERSLDETRRALSLARTMRNRLGEENALNNLGVTSKRLGEYRISLGYYEEALKLARARGDRGVEVNTLNNLGNVYRALGELEKALAVHAEALALARRLENGEHEARALNTMGQTLYQLGEFRRAVDHHDQALAIRRRLNDPTGQAASLDGAGQALHRLGEDDQAVERLSDALRIERAISDRVPETSTLLHLAVVERDLGHLGAALELADASVKVADSMRVLVTSPDLRASFVAAEQEQYELYVDVLMQLHGQQPTAGYQERALEASERGRARVLLESLQGARTEVRQGVDPVLQERERSAQRRLEEASTRLSRLMSRPSTPEELDSARRVIEELNAEYGEVLARIRRESPRYAALTQPPALTTAEIQRELDPRTLLVEFALGEERSWLWTMSSSSVQSFALPPRREIEAAARQMYASLTARQALPDESPAAHAKRVAYAEVEWRRQSIALGRMLLGPAVAQLGVAWRGLRLVIVAADMLGYLPFSALLDPAAPGQTLIEGHEIVNLPSASVLAVLRREDEHRARAVGSVAVLADPVFEAADPRVRAALSGPRGESAASAHAAPAQRSADDIAPSRVGRLSRLPFSRLEANQIASLVPALDRLVATDFEASRALATSGDLASYRVVHFATHGFLNSEHPELSGLVLSLVGRDGHAQDGFLRLSDIYNLRLAADVVVLSACQSALGKAVRGEGLVGLTRGFMYAGAPRVVASLWQVDDESTAELMRRFYQAMLVRKLAPAAALRAAQLELLATKRWATPYYWAAFVLQGEWR